MRIRYFVLGLVVCSLTALTNGCGKQETTAVPPESQPPKAADAQTAGDAQKALDAQKQADAQKLAQQAAEETKVQTLIDTAKGLSGQNKWAEALKILTDLAGQKLTPTQQGVVDGLKAEAQKQAAAALTQKATQEGANAVGGLLNPKK